MLSIKDNFRVYIAVGVTDMSKSINGLSLLVQEEFEIDLFSGGLFGVSFLAYLFSVIAGRIWLKCYIELKTDFVSG